jgi:hypothetical protein
VGLPGTKPVEDRSQVRRRNAPTPGTEWTDVENVLFDGPRLGDRPESSGTAIDRPLGVDAERWPQATLDWWEDVRRMPHAALWSAADWRFARGCAEAHARFVEGWKGCASGAEIRMRETRLGMTMDSRRDLRIRYVEPKPKDEPEALPAGVISMDSYRGL